MIDMLHIPFRGTTTYIMYEEAVENEILQPEDLKNRLLELGLQKVSLTLDEFFYADELCSKYAKLSKYDRIALSIAKYRDIPLLTGDSALRKAATNEFATVIGSIGLLDMLLEEERISINEYIHCLQCFKDKNGHGVRLPLDEIINRLNKYKM